MNTWDQLLQQTPLIEAKLEYQFKDKSLLALAFVHRSFINENRDIIDEHNERLEFLGDSVLGLIVAEYLYKYLPSTPEGELSILRSRLVEAGSCVAYAQQLGLDQHLLLGKGERMNQDMRGRDSILADLFEAVIGAIYIDGGIEPSKKFLFRHFSKEIESILSTPLNNWKAILQDYAQKKHRKPPIYRMLKESGPDHNKTFEITVILNDQEAGRGVGTSKKEAQQAAAHDALSRIPPSEL